MTTEQLSEIARAKKEEFLIARATGASYERLKIIGNEYADAVARWHKAKWPGKKFFKPSVGYLIRAL